MSGNIPVRDGSAPKTAKLSLFLGIGSVVALILSIVGGLAVESWGIINLFRSFVSPLSLAAIIVGFLSRRKIAEEGLEGYRAATTGLVLGIISIALVILTMIAAIVFFAPMLILS